MTPVRDALEAAQQFIRNGIELGYIKMPSVSTDPAHKTLPKIDAALESLSAAPGESCAVKPFGHYFWKSNGDGTESPDFCQGEIPSYKRGVRDVVPLYTTPQPAAGWDEAAGYAERLAATLWEKHFKNDAPQWKPLSGDLIGLLTQIDNMTSALHREAPVPAFDLTNHHNALKCPYCNPEGLTFARPDTTEARLREDWKSAPEILLDQIAAIRDEYQKRRRDCLDQMEWHAAQGDSEETSEFSTEAERHAASLLACNRILALVSNFKALSPPSGGDEYIDDVELSFDRTPLADSLKPPAPPADRREIVVQVPVDKLTEWASDFEAAAHEVTRGIKATVLMTRAQEVRTILDGRR